MDTLSALPFDPGFRRPRNGFLFIVDGRSRQIYGHRKIWPAANRKLFDDDRSLMVNEWFDSDHRAVSVKLYGRMKMKVKENY